MILLGPAPCRECGSPVTVERRPVVLTGHRVHCGHRGDREPCAFVESTVLIRMVVADPGGFAHACGRAEGK